MPRNVVWRFLPVRRCRTASWKTWRYGCSPIHFEDKMGNRRAIQEDYTRLKSKIEGKFTPEIAERGTEPMSNGVESNCPIRHLHAAPQQTGDVQSRQNVAIPARILLIIFLLGVAFRGASILKEAIMEWERHLNGSRGLGPGAACLRNH